MMNKLLGRNYQSLEHDQPYIVDSKKDIIQVLESISLDDSLCFENQFLSLKYLVVDYVWEKETRKKRIKENKLMIKIEELGESIMSIDMNQEEKMRLMKKAMNVVSVSDDAKNIAFRYRIWILGNLDK